MTADQLLPLLLGPAGLLVGCLWLIWVQKRELDKIHEDIRTGALIPRERFDKAEAQLNATIGLADKAIDNSEATARAIEERNRLDRERLEQSRGLSAQVTAVERRIGQRKT